MNFVQADLSQVISWFSLYNFQLDSSRQFHSHIKNLMMFFWGKKEVDIKWAYFTSTTEGMVVIALLVSPSEGEYVLYWAVKAGVVVYWQKSKFNLLPDGIFLNVTFPLSRDQNTVFLPFGPGYQNYTFYDFNTNNKLAVIYSAKNGALLSLKLGEPLLDTENSLALVPFEYKSGEQNQKYLQLLAGLGWVCRLDIAGNVTEIKNTGNACFPTVLGPDQMNSLKTVKSDLFSLLSGMKPMILFTIGQIGAQINFSQAKSVLKSENITF